MRLLLAIEILTRQKVEFGSARGSERVYRELMGFQLVLPGFDELQYGGNVQMFEDGGIFLKVRLSEFEQGGGGTQAVFLQMDERARKLDEPLIKRMFGAMTVREPELLEDFVCLEEKTAIEAFKKAEVMGVQILSLAVFD